MGKYHRSLNTVYHLSFSFIPYAFSLALNLLLVGGGGGWGKGIRFFKDKYKHA